MVFVMVQFGILRVPKTIFMALPVTFSIANLFQPGLIDAENPNRTAQSFELARIIKQ